ncbi:hypothetical protein BHM03_00055604, partial [Ensete ventricosum]
GTSGVRRGGGLEICSSSFVRAVRGTSGVVEGADLRSQIVNPLGSPKVKVVSSTSGVMTSMDRKTFKASMAMRSSHDCDSTVIKMARRAEKRASSRGEGRGSAPKKDKARGKKPAKEATEGQRRPLVMKNLYEMGEAMAIAKKRATDSEVEVERLKAT